MTRRIGLLLLLFVLAPAAVFAQWASIGDMPAPRREGNTLTFKNKQGIVAVTVLAPEIVRVRCSPTPAFGRDHSYAIVNRNLGAPNATFDVGSQQAVIATSALRVTLRYRPFRVSVADAAGNDLDADDPAQGMSFSGRSLRVAKRLREDEQIYGLGEKNGRLNKRGVNLGGYSYTMWNTDTYRYEPDTDPLYVAVPFYIVLRNGRAHGIFFDNTYRTNFDIGHTSDGLLSIAADGGEIDYYLIDGPHPKQVIQRYTEMTGRMPLPPRWSLGYQQSKYSYYPESQVRYVANSFRERRIPGEVIWLDVHYLEGFNPFTWHPEWFPDPPKLLADLRAQGFRVASVIDGHPKKQPGWAVYDSGLAGDHFVKNPDGTVFEAPVWPSKDEKNPGPSVFPDFSKPATREWWGGFYKLLTDIGIGGIWNDMDEPAAFIKPRWSLPLDVRHDNEGQPTDHREIHNVWGLNFNRSTYEALTRLRPDERPFVLTRATYAGGQRYAAIWTGDSVSTWSHLKGSIAMLTGMGLSGLPFVGTDVGGFAYTPSPDLYTRWLQTSVFYPFMRSHTDIDTPDQEPWSYGVRYEAFNRRAIELRYELLPEIYNVMQEASTTGVPAMRPLMLEFPEDPQTWDLDDQFMWGADLLVAPILRDAEQGRTVYLPKGDWYDLGTGRRYEGGKEVYLTVPLDMLPVFVRSGAFVYRQPVVQHTGMMSGQPLHVYSYPAPSSASTLYEDDGLTMAYRNGAFMRRSFRQARTATSATIDVGAPEGSYRPATRDLVVHVKWEGEPSRVTNGATSLTRYAPDALTRQASGWTIDETGFVIVKQPDRFEETHIVVER